MGLCISESVKSCVFVGMKVVYYLVSIIIVVCYAKFFDVFVHASGE